MGNPKFISRELMDQGKDPNEKIVYSFRIERQKIRKLQRGADNNNQATPELLNELIDDLITDKILTNDYLREYPQDIYFKMPIDPDLKEAMTTNPENIKPLYDLIHHSPENYGETETEIYKIKYPPNNCDIWQPNRFTYSMLEDPRKHQGIETIIIPEAEYMDDVVNFIYSIYDTETDNLELYLINLLDALNFIKKTNNIKLINRVDSLIADWQKCKTAEDLEDLANKYNTGNIIKLADTEPAPDDEDEEIILFNEANKNEYRKMTPQELEKFINEILRENKQLFELVELQDKKYKDLMDKTVKINKENEKQIKEIEKILKDHGF